MNYPFLQDDAGRSKSLRPKQKSDCVVRAFAIAIQKSYDDVYVELAAAGRKCGQGTAKEVWKGLLIDVYKISFPAQTGQKRMNLPTFCSQYPCGRYIVQMACHLTTVVDGVVHDTFAPGAERCIYACWRV